MTEYPVPTRLKIIGQTVRVILTEDVNQWLHIHGDEEDKTPVAERVGHSNWQLGAILVGTNQTPDQQADTLIHELLHSTLAAIGHNEPENEALIYRLSPVLLDLLRRNPKLVEYLMQRRLVRW